MTARARLKERTLKARRDVWRSAALDAASSLFAHQGFQATTIDDIAATAGMTRRALYEVFAGKDELLVAVLEAAAERMAASLATREEATAAERFLAAIEALLGAADDDRETFLLYARGREGARPGHDPFERFEARFHARMRELAADALAEAGLASPSPDLLAHSVLATVRAAALAAIGSGPARDLGGELRALYAPLLAP